MGAAENRNKSQKMAADLVARGYPHGRRQSKGLDNIPRMGEVGSAAYRRLQQAGRAQKQRTR